MLQLDKIHRSQSSFGVVGRGHADRPIQQKENNTSAKYKGEPSNKWQGHELHKAEVTVSFGGESHELGRLHSLVTHWRVQE